MVYFPQIISPGIQKIEQSSGGVRSGGKACNVSPAEILSVESYVSFALFH